MGEPRGRRIGEGGFGIVTLEQDLTTKKQIAVKWISPALQRESFEQEVASLAQLQHPCIVQIFGWSPATKSKEAQIRMEYVSNGSLSKLLARNRAAASWNPTQIAILICDIVMGMRYVHAHGILHRDLKPSNVLLDQHFRAKICDFGCSHREDLESAPTGETGTINYAAPEQLVEGLPYTTKTDVFAFGLLLYEIVSGTPVFSTNLSVMRIIKLHRAKYRPDPPAKSGRLMQQIIQRCWSNRQDSRPSFADIFTAFESAGFEILPHADGSAIREAVAKVIEWEQGSGRAVQIENS
jgi:serine/threonine protein kinase